MRQDYDFTPEIRETSTNTSSKSKAQPSKRVVETIQNYARCVQQFKVGNKIVKVCLN